jgi:hypothetical protein
MTTTKQLPATKEGMIARQKRRMQTAEVRGGGGVYIYRTRKPSSLLGLARIPFRWLLVATPVAAGILYLVHGTPWAALLLLFCSGRHFAYVGETVSFKDRHGEHMSGGGRWKKGAASWSDLDARCVLRIPLPASKRFLRAVETFLILVLAPVYNEKKNGLNLRRIPRNSARRMRRRRDDRRVKINVLNFRAGHLLVCIVIAVALHVIGVF